MSGAKQSTGTASTRQNTSSYKIRPRLTWSGNTTTPTMGIRSGSRPILRIAPKTRWVKLPLNLSLTPRTTENGTRSCTSRVAGGITATTKTTCSSGMTGGRWPRALSTTRTTPRTLKVINLSLFWRCKTARRVAARKPRRARPPSQPRQLSQPSLFPSSLALTCKSVKSTRRVPRASTSRSCEE